MSYIFFFILSFEILRVFYIDSTSQFVLVPFQVLKWLLDWAE